MIRWRWTLLIVVGMWVVTSLPQVVGVIQQGKYGEFLAPVQSSPADAAAYYSNIEQAKQGRLLFSNQLTSEAQQPSLFHPLWLVTGWMAALFHISSELAFFLVRLMAVAVFILVVRRLLPAFFPDSREQLLALIVLVTSSGVGWLFANHDYSGLAVLHAPTDLWVAESNTFQTLVHSAQFIFGEGVLLITVWATFMRTQNQRISFERWIGPALLLLACIHPYDLVTAFTVSLVWVLLWLVLEMPSRQRCRAMAIWLFRTWCWVVPAVAYYWFGPMQQLAVRGWFAQNITLPTTPLAEVLGMGLLLPLAVVAIFRSAPNQRRQVQFLVTWLCTSIVLSYLPHVSIARRFLGGIHIPLALLAAIGILQTQKIILKKFQTAFVICLMLFLSMTNIKMVQGYIYEITHPARAQEQLYMTTDMQRALVWLRNHSSLDQVVWASFWNSNTLVGQIARPVVFAHPNQTVKSWDREKDWKQFIQQNLSQSDRQAMVGRLRVHWLLWTTEDQQQASYHPAADSMWRAVLTTPTVTVYELQP